MYIEKYITEICFSLQAHFWSTVTESPFAIGIASIQEFFYTLHEVLIKFSQLFVMGHCA